MMVSQTCHVVGWMDVYEWQEGEAKDTRIAVGDMISKVNGELVTKLGLDGVNDALHRGHRPTVIHFLQPVERNLRHAPGADGDAGDGQPPQKTGKDVGGTTTSMERGVSGKPSRNFGQEVVIEERL